jgi:hypothetical protein
MPYWTERLTLAFLRSQESAGASVKAAAVGYDLRWPNGDTVAGAVFNRDNADQSGVTLLSLEDERIRALTTNLPVCAPGQPIPSIVIPDVSDKTAGVWSLWRISLHSAETREQRFVALFMTEDGRVFGPTGRTVWERLVDLPSGVGQIPEDLSGDASVEAFDASRKAAEVHGAAIFEELATAHQFSIARERKKRVHAYASRRRAIGRLGLPQVRAHRLREVADEEEAWSKELVAREAALPDLAPILMVRVASASKSP